MKFINGTDILEIEIKRAPQQDVTVNLDTYANANTYVGRFKLTDLIYIIRHRCNVINAKKFNDIPPPLFEQLNNCTIYDVVNYMRLLIDTGLNVTPQFCHHYVYCPDSVLYCMKRIMTYALKYASWNLREKVTTQYCIGDTTFYKNDTIIYAVMSITDYCKDVCAKKQIKLDKSVQEGCEFIYSSLSHWSYPKMNCKFFREIILLIISETIRPLMTYFEKVYVQRIFRGTHIKFNGNIKKNEKANMTIL